ncbi:regulatory protein RecX [Nesterenkonia populi]|uniref:regulatory protein RecX n=1 Tax=Nesterenkonia populi TaxID=1591087 RepID=UPI0011BDEA99|nr:regulatory protein RecX [Nesterenkonia populi]
MNDKIEELRQTVEKLESGEIRSDLFHGEAAEAPAGSGKGSRQEPAAAEGSGSEYSKARAAVLRKLTGSPKSRHQLAEALREKEHSEEIVGQVLDRMEEVQLIDDAAFAHTWVRTRHELKGLGASALRRELQEKGISPEDIEAALDQLTVEDQDAAARELVENKLRGVVVPVGMGPEDRSERDKLTRRLVNMLARRGHSPGTAFSIVRDALDTRAA